ncbi:hypothetical protein SLEP1_g25728 [Rubroshorea leprosula]|uniref:Uncharacterized protein n=1 Tax=Rubroshorea leprosula TaxID=152421 RepID=A0AAV5JTQ7_9ROSI|nr:hypothetical protein SLEP1_g25728 [Rubroshorea leprosula]
MAVTYRGDVYFVLVLTRLTSARCLSRLEIEFWGVTDFVVSELGLN